MKKICVITTISKTMDWFICDSTRNLSNNGYDVTLICNMEDGFAERNEYAKCISIPMKRGIHVSDIFTTASCLVSLFKKEKFDIVQYTTPNAAFYASIASFIAKVPIRLYSQWGIRYMGMTGMKRKIFKLVEKITCFLSTDIREVSQLNREIAIKEGLCKSNKISVIGKGGTIGIELDKCDITQKENWKYEIKNKYHIPQNNYVFGYLGRINKDKGINELITAFKELLEEYSDIHLVLVGMFDESNPISTELYDWAKQSKNVTFTGNVPSSDVYKYLAGFNVLTHPTYREGFGKVLQEAMGMELPIITTNVPGPCEVVEKDISGILVDPYNSLQLKNAMKYVKNNPEKSKLMAKNARIQAEKNYDRRIMLKNILLDMDKLNERNKLPNGRKK